MRFNNIEKLDPQVAKAIYDEVDRQRNKIELIASENFVSENVLEALGTPLQINMPKAIRASGITAGANMWT